MKLDENDVCAIVRLIAEVLASTSGHAERKRRLMEGLCKLIDADAWTWGLACAPKLEEPQVYVSLMNGGFSEQAFTKYLRALDHPEMIGFVSRFISEIERRELI